MGLTLVDVPSTEPVTLAEAKSHLRVTGADDDTLITALIVGARQATENFTHRALITQTWDLTLDAFPDEITVPLPLLQSVTSISYIDGNGASQTLASTEYTVDAKSEPGRIVPAYGKSWPVIRNIINAVTVRFVAGHADAAAVPQAIKQALLLQIGHLYEHRESVNIGSSVTELPMASEYLLWPYRVLHI